MGKENEIVGIYVYACKPRRKGGKEEKKKMST